MTPREVLITAKSRIDTPEKWIKGVNARDADGLEVSPSNPKAICFCMVGALRSTTANGFAEFDNGVIVARNILTEVLGMNTVEWNDKPNRTHAEVVAAFDLAIETTHA